MSDNTLPDISIIAVEDSATGTIRLSHAFSRKTPETLSISGTILYSLRSDSIGTVGDCASPSEKVIPTLLQLNAFYLEAEADALRAGRSVYTIPDDNFFAVRIPDSMFPMSVCAVNSGDTDTFIAYVPDRKTLAAMNEAEYRIVLTNKNPLILNGPVYFQGDETYIPLLGCAANVKVSEDDGISFDYIGAVWS